MKTVRIWKGRPDRVAILILLGLIFAVTGQAVAQVDHSVFSLLKKDFTTASEVTETCLTCHPETGKQVMQTTHWTWEYLTQDGQQLGKNNVINNYCVAISSNEPRCTSCHVGYGYKNPETFAQMGETE
ncbi:MAG: tetrathionate reductase family octaheme c-type cytochrome, partial [Planctomycetota bacterium]